MCGGRGWKVHDGTYGEGGEQTGVTHGTIFFASDRFGSRWKATERHV